MALTIFDELTTAKRSFHKDNFKVISCPLDTMIEQVREVLKSTQRDAFFRSIRTVIIGLCLKRHNNLIIAKGSKSATFEQTLLVEYTFVVDILSGFDVI